MSAQLFPVCKTRFPSRILPAAPGALARGKTVIGATLPDDSSDRGGKRENEEKTQPLPNKSEGAEVEPDDDLSDGGRGLSSVAPSPAHARIPGGSPSGQANVSTRLGLVTWNVNGLLPCLKRLGLKDLSAFLESFGPDVEIVCLQESKMQRSQLDHTLARPTGWDAFYSFSVPEKVAKVHGYSGTVTFVRQKSRPIDAKEGFSSLCCVSEIPALLERLGLYGSGASNVLQLQQERGMTPDRESSSPRKRTAQHLDEQLDDEQTEDELTGVNDVQGGGLLQLLCETSPDNLRALDSEGRCVLTDHGDFVLLNCYFPATRSTDKFEFKLDQDRFLFKLRFNICLHQAIENLRKQGRRVVLVGDLNIALRREDSCDPDMSDDFDASPSRVWLSALLNDQLLQDVFRAFHPLAQQVYTCWNQQTGARITNFGTRIDYILADVCLMGEGTGGVRMSECEIEGHEGAHHAGSDHCPVLAWLSLDACSALPSESWWATAGRGLRQNKKCEDTLQHQHAINASCATHQTPAADRDPPPMCATFLPEARRKQTSITSLFMNANASALCAATEPTPSAAIHPTLPTQLLSAIGRFQECDTPTGMRVSLPGCDMPSKGEASETAVAGRGLSAAMTYMGKGGVCKKPKISLSSLGTPAAARQKREDVSIMPEEWAQLGYQGSSRLGQDSRDASSIAGSTKSRLSPASTSLFSFFSRPNKPLGLPGTEKLGCGGDAGARQRASTLLNKTEGAGVQDGGNKDVEDSKDTEEASAKEAFEKGKQWSREEASRGAAAAWSNILCMKKQAASRPPALAPTYLSSKEQKAFLATAAEAPLCPGHSEPTIQRLVQKPGANQGRRFWVCARPNGAAGLAAARCDFFKWC